ncbi:hypothetical protein U9M48_034109 [Paspalum notatum var. saurae]|uniref:Uncharacterized protein n=1 Tax=Paspalum notatum var. saurae TaxID=547442 RepID=A0AAQ3X7K3_PASNO
MEAIESSADVAAAATTASLLPAGVHFAPPAWPSRLSGRARRRFLKTAWMAQSVLAGEYPFEALLVDEYGGTRGARECLAKAGGGGGAGGLCVLDDAGLLRLQGMREGMRWTNLGVMLGFVVSYGCSASPSSTCTCALAALWREVDVPHQPAHSHQLADDLVPMPTLRAPAAGADARVATRRRGGCGAGRGARSRTPARCGGAARRWARRSSSVMGDGRAEGWWPWRGGASARARGERRRSPPKADNGGTAPAAKRPRSSRSRLRSRRSGGVHHGRPPRLAVTSILGNTLSMCVSVTNIIPNFDGQEKISSYTIDKNGKKILKSEFDKTTPPVEICNRLWKTI